MKNLTGTFVTRQEFFFTVLSNTDKITKDKQVIVYCRSGNRSGVVINALEKQFGYDNLFNLKGGILAYAREIDDSLPIY